MGCYASIVIKDKSKNQNQILQDSLFKILDFLRNFKKLKEGYKCLLEQMIGWKNPNNKNKVDKIKKQITELPSLSIDERYHCLNKYIDDKNYKLRFNILIVNGKIAENTITDIDKIYKHSPILRLECLFLSFVKGNC